LVGGEGVVEDPEFVDGAAEGGVVVGLVANVGRARVVGDGGEDFAGGVDFAGLGAVEVDGEGAGFGPGVFPDPGDVMPGAGGDGDVEAFGEDVGGVAFGGEFGIAEHADDFSVGESEGVGVWFCPIGEEVIIAGAGEFDPGGDGERVFVDVGERRDAEAVAAGPKGGAFSEGDIFAVVESGGGFVGDGGVAVAGGIGEGFGVVGELIEGPVSDDVGGAGGGNGSSKEQEAGSK